MVKWKAQSHRSNGLSIVEGNAFASQIYINVLLYDWLIPYFFHYEEPNRGSVVQGSWLIEKMCSEQSSCDREQGQESLKNLERFESKSKIDVVKIIIQNGTWFLLDTSVKFVHVLSVAFSGSRICGLILELPLEMAAGRASLFASREFGASRMFRCSTRKSIFSNCCILPGLHKFHWPKSTDAQYTLTSA